MKPVTVEVTECSCGCGGLEFETPEGDVLFVEKDDIPRALAKANGRRLNVTKTTKDKAKLYVVLTLMSEYYYVYTLGGTEIASACGGAGKRYFGNIPKGRKLYITFRLSRAK